MFGRCQNLGVLTQMMRLYFRLEQINTRDIDSQLVFVGLASPKPDTSKGESNLDLFYQLLSISIADKLLVNQQFVPLYSPEDLGIIVTKTIESMSTESTEEEIESVALSAQTLYEGAIESTRIFSQVSGNEYEVFWQWIDSLVDVMRDFDYTDISQVPATIEIYDEIIRRLYTKEQFSNLIDIIHQSIGDYSTLWNQFESAFVAEDIEINGEISGLIESSIGDIQNQLLYTRDYLISRIYSN